MATKTQLSGADLPASPPTLRDRWKLRGAFALFILLLISNGPLFVCMPLTADASFFDLQADLVREGGVLYRDIFEVNLPGVVWLHLAIRSLLGPGSEVMRMADLFLFSAIVAMLVWWVRRQGAPQHIQVMSAVLMYWFYFSLSEWCHCQRDTWMLLPALVAVAIRARQTLRLRQRSDSSARVLSWGVIEGILWGTAFWIKPHVAVPALVCWVVSAMLVGRNRWLIADLGGLLAGGLAAGSVGTFWLVSFGAWPSFWEIVCDWHRDYVSSHPFSIANFLANLYRFLFPWIVLHCIAVPLACASLSRKSSGNPTISEKGMSAFYLAWLAQSLWQQNHAYVHAPAVLMAIAIIAANFKIAADSRFWRPAVIGFLLLAAIYSPALNPHRLECWVACFREGSSPRIRDRLGNFVFPDWQDLERTAQFLERKPYSDRRLVCYSNSALYLYGRLGKRPACRYAHPRELISFFPSHRAEIHASVAAIGPHCVVADLALSNMTLPEASGDGSSPVHTLTRPESRAPGAMYPWSHRVIFRAGRYVVFEVSGPVGSFREPSPSKH